MADLQWDSLPWTDLQDYPRLPAPGTMETDITSYLTLTSALKESLRGGVFDVAAYGASGSGLDERAAIQSAIDAAESNGGGTVLFHAKEYRVSSSLVVDSANVTLAGQGLLSTAIKFTDDSTETGYLVEMGTSSQLNGLGVRDMELDGNKGNVSTASGCLYVKNSQHGRFDNIRVTSSAGVGIMTGTTASGGASTQSSNVYTRIYSNNNNGYGQRYTGEINSIWSGLRSGNDCASGTDGTGAISFEADDTTTIRETTEVSISNVKINDSGRFGLILDGAARLPASTVMIEGCNDSPVFFRNSHTTGVAPVGRIQQIALSNFVLRNNAESVVFLGWAGIETDDTATYVTSVGISNWIVDGLTQANFSPGVFDVRGWQNFRFTDVQVRNCKGDCWNVSTGVDVDNSTVVQPTGGKWIACHAAANGNASATSNNGIALSGSSSNMLIVGTTLKNALTNSSDSSYEITVGASVTNVVIVGCDIDANENGYEYSIASGAEDEVILVGNMHRNNPSFPPSVTLTAAANQTITLPVEAVNAGVCVIDDSAGGTVQNITASVAGASVVLTFTNGGVAGVLNNSGGNIKGTAAFSSTAANSARVTYNGSNWHGDF